MCQKIVEHYRAGFPVFLLKTSETSRVKYEVEAKLSEFKFKDGTSPEILSWSITSSNNSPPTTPLQGLLEHEGPAILFLYNYHWFIDKPPVIQTIQDCFSLWANQRKAIVMVSHTDKIPPELERDVTVVDLKLPTPEEIEDIVKHESPTEKHLPTGDSLKQVVASSKGLSRRELQNVYNLSLIQKNSFDIKVINEYRSQAIKKSGLATVVNPDISIDDIIGYDTPKDFVLSTINNPEAKGVIFIGPPGCGRLLSLKHLQVQAGS